MNRITTLILLLWLPFSITGLRNNFLGASFSFTLDQNVDKSTNAHVQLMTRWVLGQGPCGKDCSFELSDLHSSTLNNRHEIESAQNNTAYFGNFTLTYVDNGTLLVDPLLDNMATTISETVAGLDEVEKWEEDEMFFSIRLPETSQSTYYTIDFTGHSWIPLLFHGDDLPWHLQAVIQYTEYRNDTGTPNHSPKVVAEPISSVTYNETTILTLQVTDDDGDDVRCEDKNNGSSSIVVHSNCSVTIDANELDGYINDSWVAVFLKVSDFPRVAVEIGSDIVKPDTPLSSVDAQVTVHVVAFIEVIQFLSTTPPGTTFDLYVGQRWTTLIYIHANTRGNLTVIVDSSKNTTLSSTASIEPPTAYQPNYYVASLSLTPDRDSVGSNRMCIKVAADNDGAESAERCYSFNVNTPDPCDVSPCIRGVCFSHLDDYYCVCPVGYQGRHCEKDIDECSTRPCKNNGVCTDDVNSFTCECPLGYAGPVCDDTKGPNCFSCTNITSLSECTTVTTCQNSERCGVERVLSAGSVVFNVGCRSQHSCDSTVISSDHCLSCCKGDYCNRNGCELPGFPDRFARGPLCFDCDDIEHASSCKTVVQCQQDEVCTFYGSRFTNFDSKCYHKDFPCGGQTSAGDQSYLCHTCCQDDFCNTSCNQTTPAEPNIIG